MAKAGRINYGGDFTEFKKRKRNDRIKRAIIVAGGIGAMGLGAYFGTKHGFKSLSDQQRRIAASLDLLHEGVSGIGEVIQNDVNRRSNQMTLIDAALETNTNYQFFPGLGVRFESGKDMERVLKAVKRPLFDVA